MSSPRSLLQLRKLVGEFRSRAARKGLEVEMGAIWSYSYRPADDQEQLKEISEAEFKGEPESGHPRAGVYGAVAKDDDGQVLFDFDGEWLPDLGGMTPPPEEAGGMGGLIATLAKTTTATLNNAATSETTANRRAAQAETRAIQAQDKLHETLETMQELRNELHIAKIAKQGAEQRQREAEAQREAAIADLEEMRKAGGELVAPATAMATKLWRFFAVQMGEDPTTAIDADLAERALRQACEEIVRWAQDMSIPDVEMVDGTTTPVMVALYLHHKYGLPWKPLRIVFFYRWAVDLTEAPPPGWTPPGDDTEGAPPPPAAAEGQA